MEAAPIPLDTLLAHREWVRVVARAVVRDPNAADDIEQETWLAALRSPQRNASSLRGWFGAVARSRARRIGRGESRREAREAVVSHGGTSPSAAELAEIADTHRRVVQAVVELDEPYRQTILLRYFEGLAIEDVAARTGVPLETARSRIKRGVAKLRERLARELGRDERPWHLALVPLIEVRRGTAAATAAGGGAVMASSTKTVLAVAAVLALAGAGVFLAVKSKNADESNVADAPRVPPTSKRADEKPAATPPLRAPRRRAGEETPATPGPDTATSGEKPPGTSKTAKDLDQIMVNLEWQDLAFMEAIAALSEATGVEVAVSQEVADKAPDNRLTLQLENVSAKQALKLITMLGGLDFVVEEPRVVIVPKGVTRDPGKPVVVPPKPKPKVPVTLLGKVTDAAGAPVVDAEILRAMEDGRVIATTGIDGRYEVKDARKFGLLYARAKGHVPSYATTADGEPGAQVVADFALRGAAGAVKVTVTTEKGPAPHVVVNVGPRGDTKVKLPDGRDATQRARIAWTNKEGEATFDGVAPGEALVHVQLKGYEDGAARAAVAAGDTAEVGIRLVPKASLADRLAQKKTTIALHDTSLADACSYLSRVANVRIVLNPSSSLRTKDVPVTLVLDQPTSVADVLAEIARLTGMKVELNEPQDVVYLRSDR